ncbi:TPA: orotate phosphoribosyltransferase [Candidatus Acetothermia bacterium]|nr:orotate phosphoribosyltransferase [Candidatus Acetothermia bacterium]HAZ30189.1 orotate phosphoribosyltransferase [Candidatus Acetothermia bacterium]
MNVESEIGRKSVDALTGDQALALLRETEALLEGHFLLSSGLHSPRYIQCARLLQHPAHAARVGQALAAKVRALGAVDAVVGPALGGIIVAYELGRALGVRGLFTERDQGTMTLRRGFWIAPGERVLVAEDVVTTGRSSLEVASVVEAHGGRVVGVACLVDRRPEDDLALPLVALVKMTIATHPPEACPLCRGGVPLVKPGSRSGTTAKTC